jgi:ABC-type glycerol-3-phosphate transport system substrate-binding protein
MIKRLKKMKWVRFLNEYYQKVKAFFIAFGLKKTLLSLISLVLVVYVVASFFRVASNNLFFDARALTHAYEDSAALSLSESTYSTVKKGYLSNNYTHSSLEETFNPIDMTGSLVTALDPRYQAPINAYAAYRPGANDTVSAYHSQSDKVTFSVGTIPTGLYYIAVDYYELSESVQATQVGVKVNGSFPFYESRTLILESEWVFDSTEFQLDRYKNEIQPSSSKQRTWKTMILRDLKGMHAGYYEFYLKSNDEITLEHVSGEYLIGQVHFVQVDDLLSYDAYLNQHAGATVVNQLIQVSAKDLATRNDASIRLRAERDPSSLHYDTQFLKMNTIFGDSWQNGGQAVTYEIEVETAGFYHVSFKYRQYMIKDMPVFRKIYINGEVPFDLLESYAFPYTTSFMHRTLTDENNDTLKIYLEAGTNTITLEAVLYPYRNTIESIKYIMSEIQDLALRIKKYTSGGTDRYRDWDIETYFPNAEGDIRFWALELDQIYNELLVLTNNNAPSEILNLRVAATRLRSIANNVNKLPGRMVQFSDGDSSVNQMLGDLMQRLMRANIELERTMVHGDKALPKPYANVFVSTWEGLKRLVLSFINNPYSTQRRTQDELVVWVNHPRQYIEIMQMMIDQSYDGDMKVTLSQMPDQNKLILANVAGNSPDVAIGVDHWIPYEFAIRDASLDLRQFEGYADLVTNFTKGAMIPYVFEDGVFGIPETQNFWVTYYRTDILNSIGITEIPQTWDEIIEILPLLQSYGMNYFVPLAQYEGLKPFVATLPFIYQFGGDLYAPNGMSTAINSDQTLEGIQLMSNLYTLYNLPQRVASFYNQFRYGTLPIGISDLSSYILLSTAASELDGLWSMDLHPGVYNEITDEIVRYSAVGAQASMILSSTQNKAESWDFLSWWMSTEVQSDFAFNLQTTYGRQYFWNSANVNAFMNSSMPERFKNVVLEQWTYGIEASRIPGAYMVERELSNAWSKVVYNGTNVRLALDDAVRISNREILYKMAEFGYVQNGVIIKNYTVPSIYNIDLWLTEVNNA